MSVTDKSPQEPKSLVSIPGTFETLLCEGRCVMTAESGTEMGVNALIRGSAFVL